MRHSVPGYKPTAALRREAEPTANGDPDLVVRLILAAYKAGPGAIKEHRGMPPFNATEQYVARILVTG